MYAELHKDEKAAYIRQYYIDNKEDLIKKQKPRTAKREAIKKRAFPKWANLHEVALIYYNCPEGYHVDHIIPLQGKLITGFHIETNLQYLKAEDNMSKHNKFVPYYEKPNGEIEFL